jgi:hypothetical protein
MEGMPNAKRRDATRLGTTEAPTGGFNFYLVRTDPLTSTYTRRWAETDLPNHTAATLSGATLELVEAQQLSTTTLVVYSRVRCRSNLSKRYNARAPFHSALSQHRQMRSQRARSLMWQMKRERIPLKRPLMVKRAVPTIHPLVSRVTWHSTAYVTKKAVGDLPTSNSSSRNVKAGLNSSVGL